MVIWYIFPRFCMFYQKKSGTPATYVIVRLNHSAQEAALSRRRIDQINTLILGAALKIAMSLLSLFSKTQQKKTVAKLNTTIFCSCVLVHTRRV
jgi:hypothetical protein